MLNLDDLPEIMDTAQELINLRIQRKEIATVPSDSWATRGWKTLAMHEHLLSIADRKDIIRMIMAALDRTIQEKETALKNFGIDPGKPI